MPPSPQSNDKDGWTLVIHHRHRSTNPNKKRNRKAPRHTHNHSPTTNSNAASSAIDPHALARSLSQIQHCRERWRAAPSSSRLRDALTQQLSKRPIDHIAQAVMAGLGNLDPASPRDTWRATWQLALFLELLALLSRASSLPVYAQDPAFTPFDAAVLAAVGVEVLPGDEAVERVGARTFLFVPFVDAVVLLPRIVGGREMGVFVGSDVAEVVERVGMVGYAKQTGVEPELVEESLVVGRRFLETMERVEGNVNSVDEVALFGLAVFVRKSEVGGGYKSSTE